MEAAEGASTAQEALVDNPAGEAELASIRDLQSKLQAAYATAISTRVAKEGLFQDAAEAVVAGGDAFGQIYSSVSAPATLVLTR